MKLRERGSFAQPLRAIDLHRPRVRDRELGGGEKIGRDFRYWLPEALQSRHRIGETAQLGFDKALDKLVQQIVGMMEEPW